MMSNMKQQNNEEQKKKIYNSNSLKNIFTDSILFDLNPNIVGDTFNCYFYEEVI